MNKCRHCGAFVPIEKAFCPNCSEPIEPEEAPNRAASASSDMMATLRDDPEHYKELLQALKKPPASPTASTPAQAPEAAQASAAAAAPAQPPQPPPPPTWPSASDSAAPQIADHLPPVKSSKRSLAFIIGAISFLILLFIILKALKLI